MSNVPLTDQNRCGVLMAALSPSIPLEKVRGRLYNLFHWIIIIHIFTGATGRKKRDMERLEVPWNCSRC